MNSAAHAFFVICLLIAPNVFADVIYKFIDNNDKIATLTVPTLSTIPAHHSVCSGNGPAPAATLSIGNKMIYFRISNWDSDALSLAPEILPKDEVLFLCGFNDEIYIGMRFMERMKAWNPNKHFTVARPDLPIVGNNPCSRSIGILYLYYPVPGAQQGWYCLKSSSPNAGSVAAANPNTVFTPIASPTPINPSPSFAPAEVDWNLPTPPAEIYFPARKTKNAPARKIPR